MSKFIDAREVPPPKNRDLLLLLVKAEARSDPTEDAKVFRTIGFNAGDDNGEDEWHIVGWNWCSDEFIETIGEIIGWMEIPEIPKEFLKNE